MDSSRAISPAEAAAQLGASEWWVREQCRRKRVPHQRYGRERIALLPEQVAALAALATVQPAVPRRLPDAVMAAMGATPRSRAAHRAGRLKVAGGNGG
jgi:hypothetical protein